MDPIPVTTSVGNNLDLEPPANGFSVPSLPRLQSRLLRRQLSTQPTLLPTGRRNAMTLCRHLSRNIQLSRNSSACSCLAITPSTTTVPCHTVTMATTLRPPAPTITITATPPATTTPTVFGPATALPAICKPSLFRQYKSGVDSQDLDGLVQSTETTEQACCVACFNAKDCTVFQFWPENGPEARWEYYTRRAQTDPSNRKDICPLGVSRGSGLDSLPELEMDSFTTMDLA